MGRAASSIEVALATYQSERFLRPLLDSLFAQTEQGFTLLVADDGSSDATTDILEEYSRLHEGRIRIVARDRQSGGASGNFGRLIEHASADYVFLCDHDDVWSPNKIALTLARMQELVGEYGHEMPLLVHTDLVVVDANLAVLDSSLFRYANVDPTRNDLAALLLRNVASGCTMVINRALYERGRPIPPQAMMHDHWLALVAAAFGVIACVAEPTILYRQHGGNVCGARSGSPASWIRRACRTLVGDDRQRIIQRYSQQAAVLLQRYGSEMSHDARRTTATLAEIWTINRWRRFARLRRHGIGLSSFVRNAGLLVVLVRGLARDKNTPQVPAGMPSA